MGSDFRGLSYRSLAARSLQYLSLGESLAELVEEDMFMDAGRILLFVVCMFIATGCQSTPPSQDKEPPAPPSQAESDEESMNEPTDPSIGPTEQFDGLEESDDPVVPPDAIEGR